MKINLENFMHIVNLRHAASTDETRYHLNGVHFNLKTGLGEATDGHILTQAQIGLTDENREENDPESLIIPPQALTAMAKVKKKEKHMFTVKLSFKSISLQGLETNMTWELIAGTFPRKLNTSPIWDSTKSSETFSVSFNPELLAKIHEALKDDKESKENLGLTFTFNSKDNKSPIAIRRGDKKALLMPMRM